jgi:hypothetical protein
MPAEHEIRADYDRDTIVIYQAYAPAIADAALKAGRFRPPCHARTLPRVR